jgi:hypothetical protein
MTRQFFITLLAALACALIAYAGSEALHLLFEYIAPDTSVGVYIAVRLLTHVTLVEFMVRIEVVVTIWHRRNSPYDPQ